MPESTPADRISARTDAEAKKRFLQFLSLSLSCVAPNAQWLVVPGRDDGHAVVTVPQETLALPTGPATTVYLRSTILFKYTEDLRYQGERKVSTLEYAHTVSRSETLKPGLYSWEWSQAEPRYPHVHVRRSDPDHPGLGKFHVPTGRVFFENVILFLIQEHGVIPQRDDWRDILGESFRRVSKFSSWGGGPGAARPPA